MPNNKTKPNPKSGLLRTDELWNSLVEHPWFKHLAGIIIFASLAHFLFNAVIQPTLWRQSIDFGGYYQWAKYLNPKLADVDPPWINYPPFWGLVLKPFTLLPFATVQHLWRAIQVFLVFFFIWSANRWLKEVRTPAIPYLYLTFLFFITLCYTPVIATLSKGQVNILILVLLGLSLWLFFRKQHYLSGIILGITTMIKILPGFLILYWFWKREYAIALSAIITIILIFLTTIGLLGLPMHIDWVKQTMYYAQYIRDHWTHQANISLYAILQESQAQGLLPIHFAREYLQTGIILGVILLFLGIIPRRKQLLPEEYTIEYSFAVSCIPLISIYTESHHFTFGLLGFIAVIAAAKQSPYVGKGLIMLAWLTITTGYHIIDKTLFPSQCYLLYFSEMFGAILLWLGLGYILIYKRIRFLKQQIPSSDSVKI
ncbi:MAG: glycosyltransferase family 87 protein [bacterium]|nr:glycosyltransferase family 87 protein [bacterium]